MASFDNPYTKEDAESVTIDAINFVSNLEFDFFRNRDEYPNLRFGQYLCNFLREHGCEDVVNPFLFYKEDNQWDSEAYTVAYIEAQKYLDKQAR